MEIFGQDISSANNLAQHLDAALNFYTASANVRYIRRISLPLANTSHES